MSEWASFGGDSQAPQQQQQQQAAAAPGQASGKVSLSGQSPAQADCPRLIVS